VTPIAAPEDVGFAPGLADKLAAGLRSGLLRDLHGLLVARNGQTVLEHYGEGLDNAWGRPLGSVAFGPDTLHDLRSVTKSIVGLLYGIALDSGLVPPPAAPLMPSFAAAYPDLATDPARAGLTIGHALTMTLGLEWDEQRPYTDPANSEIAMEAAPDRIRFVLERPLRHPPGACWTYSGGAVALLGRLIADGTGKTLPEFAREAMFAPLGIDAVEWAAARDGVASAASGLRLRPRDLLRIGLLVLAGGEHQGRQIVPAEWLAASFRPAIETGDGLEYGRLWFLGEAVTPALRGLRRWAAGFGNGGQRLWLMPDAKLAVVSLSGAYDRPDAWITPNRIWREIVLANLLEA
jgi:CubicO group peptidase (beta-lactamase class C family)